MPLYIVRIVQTNPSFRLPALKSIAQTYDFGFKIISKDWDRSIIILELEKEDHVQRLLDRGIQIIWMAELYAQGDTMEQLHERLQANIAAFEPYRHQSFKISAEGANLRISNSRQVLLASSFDYLDLPGKIDLSSPENEYIVFEDYEYRNTTSPTEQRDREGQFMQVYFGRRIGDSRMRPLIHAFSVKTRDYYGNTSMESEMGFFMAIQTLAAPGKIIYDPFAGTGSLLYSCAKLGAMVMGSDIDGRQMRGKKRGKGVTPGYMRAAQQYGVDDVVLGCTTFDVTQHPWRKGGWLDAMITDPPYGVRAGAKRLGKRDPARPMRDEPYVLEDGTYAHQAPTYLPPSRPYELLHLTLDIIRLARYMLVPRGRLVFFLPTVSEDYDAIDIPVVEGMRELKCGDGSVQDFGKWGRRLITMEKTAEDDGPAPTFSDYEQVDGTTAGHKDFNKRYAQGFSTRSETNEASI